MAGKKRSTNERAKAKRARSWQRNQEAKKLRIADQEARQKHNQKVGTTGKQRDNALRKAAKNGEIRVIETSALEQEDLLET